MGIKLYFLRGQHTLQLEAENRIPIMFTALRGSSLGMYQAMEEYKEMAPNIILFTYDISVFGRKIEWYLILRGISYKKCIVRNRLPREVMEELGIKYRRIPVLAIERDIYCDTRCIIPKLEELFPENRLGGKTAFDRGVEYLLENWIIDGGPYVRTQPLIPPTAEVMNDPSFIKDRSEMVGMTFTKETLASARPDALAQVRMYFHFLETTMLADGRTFLLNTAKPTLADIQAGWLFDWNLQQKMGMYEALEKGTISENSYPKVFAWVQSIREAVAEDEKQRGEAGILSDKETVKQILSSDYFEEEGSIDGADPLKLKKGQLVDITSTDDSLNHHSIGELVSIGVTETVIQTEVPNGKGSLRLHFPRTNFKVVPAQDVKS